MIGGAGLGLHSGFSASSSSNHRSTWKPSVLQRYSRLKCQENSKLSQLKRFSRGISCFGSRFCMTSQNDFVLLDAEYRMHSWHALHATHLCTQVAMTSTKNTRVRDQGLLRSGRKESKMLHRAMTSIRAWRTSQSSQPKK